MSYASPWRWPAYRGAVAALRRLLRATPLGEERLIDALVRGNNRRVRRHLARRGAGRVLLILPRCVKRPCCRVDRGGSLAASRECRECDLGEMARLADRHGVEALVAFRSHIAYEMARRERPDLIIATACGDRLIKALRSVPEIPALLAPLTGMERMCVNATFDPAWFESQLAAAAGAAGGERRAACAQSGA